MKLYGKGLLSLTAVTFLLTSCGSETKGDAAANVTVNKDNLEDTAGFLAGADGGSSGASAPSGGWDDDEDDDEEDEEECCCDYCATVTGQGVTLSSDVTGTTVTGQLQIGFPTPLDWLREACGEVSGTLNTISTFTTSPDEDCLDINNPACLPVSTLIVSDIKCLEVDVSPIGKKAWFSGTNVSSQSDPRVSAAENAQTQLQISQGNYVQLGSITDPNVGPNTRSLFTSAVINPKEGQDNAVSPIGGLGSVSPLITCGGLTAENLCLLKDQALSQNSDFELVCNNPALVCAANPAIVGCVQPTPAANGIGFANDNSLACWIANTRIQWLEPNTEEPVPVGDPVANTVANLCNPPAGINYSISGLSRTFSSGDIKIKVRPAQ